MAAGEVRRFLEELDGDGEGGGTGGLERVVFCIFEEKDQRAYGKWLPYVFLLSLSHPIPSHPTGRKAKNQSKREFLTCHYSHSKIFPPTPEDLASEDGPTEAEAATVKEPLSEEASVVSNDAASEPQAKKLKTSTEDLDKDDWEAVEKPSETATDVSEEGEEVEAVGLGGSGSDGEKVEKNVVGRKEETKAGVLQPENTLAKDW